MTTKSRDSRSLLADDSGATMVMGVFMALMVVGMIYYVWGLGGTIIYRERMQDAVDAGAFGASVYAAAGMNLIAFLNVIMCVLATIATILRLMYDFIDNTTWNPIGGDVELCIECAATVVGDLVGACEVQCEEAADHVEEYESSDWMNTVADDAIDPIIRACHYAQVAISYGAFVGGEAQAVGAEHFNPNPVNFGVLVPGNVASHPGQIQSENDTTNWACDGHGTDSVLFGRDFIEYPAEMLADIGDLVFFEPPSLGYIAGYLSQRLDGASYSERYCNNGSLTFQRVPTDAWLGDQSFQNYVVDFHTGTLPYEWTQRGVQASNWGREGNSAPNVLGLDLSMVGELHRLSLADSEYYYEITEDDAGQDGDDPLSPLYNDHTPNGRHQEWLWHPRWRARMRRFHAAADVLGRFGSSALQEVESVIVH